MAAAQAINYLPLITLIEQKTSQPLSLQDLIEISKAIETLAEKHLKKTDQNFDNPDSIKRLVLQIRRDISNDPSFRPTKKKLHIATGLACQTAQKMAEQCTSFVVKECLEPQLSVTYGQENVEAQAPVTMLNRGLPFYVNSDMTHRNDQVKRIGMLNDLTDPLEKEGLFTPRDPIITERTLTLLTYEMNNE